MSEADRWRICPHPSLVAHPLPERLPVVPNNLLTWVPPGEMFNPPDLRRCVLCGQVGELAKPNV